MEITKIPVSSNAASPLATALSTSSFKSSTPKAEGDSPLNLSMKTPFMSPLMESYASKSQGGSKIPQEYYACKLIYRFHHIKHFGESMGLNGL